MSEPFTCPRCEADLGVFVVEGEERLSDVLARGRMVCSAECGYEAPLPASYGVERVGGLDDARDA